MNYKMIGLRYQLARICLYITIVFYTGSARADTTWEYIRVGGKAVGLGVIGIAGGIALIAAGPELAVGALVGTLLTSGGIASTGLGIAVIAASPAALQKKDGTAGAIDNAIGLGTLLASPGLIIAAPLAITYDPSDSTIECMSSDIGLFNELAMPLIPKKSFWGSQGISFEDIDTPTIFFEDPQILGKCLTKVVRRNIFRGKLKAHLRVAKDNWIGFK